MEQPDDKLNSEESSGSPEDADHNQDRESSEEQEEAEGSSSSEDARGDPDGKSPGEQKKPEHPLIDSEAFEALFTQHRDPLFGYLAGMVGKAEAEDLSQDAFLRAWKNLSELRDATRFSTWLYRIARHLTIDYLRRKKRLTWQPLEEDFEEHPGFQDPIDRLYQQDLIRRTLVELAKQVSKKVYECFLLSVVAERTDEEIAEILHLKYLTVRVYISQARRPFRQIYEQLEQQER